MWRRLSGVFFAFVILGFWGRFGYCDMSAANPEKFVIVKNGEPGATIVVSESASLDEIFAAEELQNYIRKSSSVLIPVKKDGEKLTGNVIAVGRSRLNTSSELGFDNLKREGFRIKTNRNILSVVGKDDAGTQFAVYTFLEKYLGVRWLWPGELGEVVPKMQTIEVGQVDDTDEPDFKWRNRGPSGALWGATSGPTEMHARELLLGITPEHQKQVELWEKRNKWGGMKIYGGHSLGEIFPPEKYAKTHPEYYALVKGKRDVPGPDYDYKHGCQICTSNPEVLKVAVEWASKFFDEHPNYDGVHMTLNDGGGFCECENCRVLDSTESVADKSGIDAEETAGRAGRENVITDRVFTFMNQISQQLQQTHPGKYVVSMAYSRYIEPPKTVKPDKYVIPQYCLWSAYLHANAEEKAKHERIAAGWANVSDETGIYEYFINGSWPGLHRLTPYHFAESIKWLYKQGIELYQTQSGDEFGINGVNYYVTGRLLWDTSLSEEQVLDDFYQKGFGRAAAPIKQFHKRLIEAWDRETAAGKKVACYSIKDTQLFDYFTPKLFEQCYADLDEADKLADDELVRQRIEFYRKGLRFTELTVNAAAASKRVVDKIYRDNANAFGFIRFLADKKNEQLVRDALAAWAERDTYADNLKNDYVLAYFWVRYGNETRNRFYAVDDLKNLLKLFSTEGLTVESAH